MGMGEGDACVARWPGDSVAMPGQRTPASPLFWRKCCHARPADGASIPTFYGEASYIDAPDVCPGNKKTNNSARTRAISTMTTIVIMTRLKAMSLLSIDREQQCLSILQHRGFH